MSVRTSQEIAEEPIVLVQPIYQSWLERVGSSAGPYQRSAAIIKRSREAIARSNELISRQALKDLYGP